MKILFLLHDFQIDPLGVGYLSSALKKAGHDVDIVKTKHGIDNVYTKLQLFAPDILAYSVTTGWHKYYLKINKTIKGNYIRIFGGPHATFFPELAKEKGVDYVIQGEAEKSFVSFVNLLQAHRTLSLDTKIIKPGNLEHNLDDIEFPDRDLMYSYPENADNPVFNVMMSRGCPYSCSYCFNSIYKKIYSGQKTLRYRSVENVLKECEEVVRKYPQKKFLFLQDDEFIVNYQLLKEFTKQYVKRVGLPYHCQLRAEFMTKRKAQMLKDSGCVSVTFAIESGNDDIRIKMLNRKVNKDKYLACCKILKKVGLKYRTENMVGLPGETLNEALETLDFNIKCKPDLGWVSLFQPYPKTDLGDLCEKMLLYDGDVDKLGNDFFGYSVLKRDLQRRFNNLQKIFGLVVAFPFLRPFVRFLIWLPENRFYNWISTKYRRYCYDKKLYVY